MANFYCSKSELDKPISCGLCGKNCPVYVREPLSESLHDGYKP